MAEAYERRIGAERARLQRNREEHLLKLFRERSTNLWKKLGKIADMADFLEDKEDEMDAAGSPTFNKVDFSEDKKGSSTIL